MHELHVHVGLRQATVQTWQDNFLQQGLSGPVSSGPDYTESLNTLGIRPVQRIKVNHLTIPSPHL